MTEDEMIDRIFEIRVSNNDPWKRLMKLALRVAPIETRKILDEIYSNDIDVCVLMDKLCDPSRDSS